MKLRLRIESPGSAPSDVTLDEAEVVIGRAAGVGLLLADPSVSRQHALLVHRAEGWWLEELSATNPTFVNQERVVGPRRLRQGDRLALGATTLLVLGTTAASPSPADTGDRQAARLAILNDVHRALAAAVSLPELLDLILDRTFDVLAPEEGLILLRKPDGSIERAATRQAHGASGDVVVSRRIVDEVIGKMKPALVMDAAMDERLLGSESIIVSGIRSVVAAPLADAEGALGLIVLSSRVRVRQFTEADLDLLVSLASAAALRMRNVALAEEAAARRVLDRELALAHEIQMSMLPRRPPDRPEVVVAASLTPARSVGGDLYDFSVDGDRLWFIIADVAGKGVGAALYMAVTTALFRASAHGGAPLAAVVDRINREICRDNDTMLFVTALIGTVFLPTGEVAIVDAGHNPAMVLGRSGALTVPVVPKNAALGVVDDAVFREGRFVLLPGDTLVLHTDGATDARDLSGELFGMDRLQAAVRAARGKAPLELVPAIAADVERFAAGAPPEDDLTLLAIQYRGHAAGV